MPDAGYVPPPGEIQLQLAGMGPVAGERYRNRNTGTIVAVLRVDQRRIGWVTIRVNGAEQTITLASLERSFERLPSIPRRHTR